ncbi:MAG: methionyl-tRNA formyltransferase [Acidimicrobiia bacterium]|nr:methionyl-tRNA formyltransferase [Acidimicrobiia bacterium]
MISTAFLGTPAAAIPSLVALASRTDVKLVITRPDRPRGRSSRARPSPIKEAATELDLRIAQPFRREELEAVLAGAAPFDVGVVVAYGLIVSPSGLAIPRRGFVNVHFSLLPRWRGAAPVERAILAGDTTSGVTLMVMDEGLDTGPILASQPATIGPGETAGELTVRLAHLGAGLLSEHLIPFSEGNLVARPQASEGVTYADRITTAEAVVEATRPAADLLRAVRAYSPRPGARLAGGDFKVWEAAPTEVGAMPAGHLHFDGRRLLMGTGDLPIELVEVQSAGGKRMSGAAWARGRQGDLGRLT